MKKDFKLPKDLYFRTQWLIRGYYRLREEYKDIVWAKNTEQDGMPRSTEPGNPTERDAIKLAEKSADIDAIEKALRRIPEEYRKGIMESIIYHRRYPDTAHLNTWKNWRQRLVYWTAYYKNWI